MHFFIEWPFSLNCSESIIYFIFRKLLKGHCSSSCCGLHPPRAGTMRADTATVVFWGRKPAAHWTHDADVQGIYCARKLMQKPTSVDCWPRWVDRTANMSKHERSAANKKRAVCSTLCARTKKISNVANQGNIIATIKIVVVNYRGIDVVSQRAMIARVSRPLWRATVTHFCRFLSFILCWIYAVYINCWHWFIVCFAIFWVMWLTIIWLDPKPLLLIRLLCAAAV